MPTDSQRVRRNVGAGGRRTIAASRQGSRSLAGMLRAGVRLAACAGLIAGCLIAATACSDSSQRMGEGETLRYKQALLRENADELSPDAAHKLLYFPGRTKESIDDYVEDLKAQYAQTKAAEEAAAKADASATK